jgi:cell division protein FtsA
MPRREEIIVGLDIGTTKVAAIVGAVSGSDVEIIGLGTAPSRGLNRGVVVNIDATVASIQRAIKEAAEMAGCEITTVYAGIAGNHIRGQNSQGMEAVRGREVRDEDVTRVIQKAKAVPIPMDREIIHVLPQEFVVDQQDGIREPVGMSGVRLEVKAHIVTAAVSSAQNIVKCANRCGLNVAELVLQPLASAMAVLDDNERELGVALIDIGGGTTDMTIYVDGSVVHTAVLGVAGNHVTQDIAKILCTPRSDADRLKVGAGCALSSMAHREETIEVPSVGGRAPQVLPRWRLAEIIEARITELYELCDTVLERAGLRELLGAGAVITGGTSLVEGIEELGVQALRMPVRRGVPRGVGELGELVRSPVYATGVGLVLYGARQGRAVLAGGEGVVGRARHRVRDWFKELFF